MVARSLGVILTLVGAQVPAIDGTHAWLGYLLTLAVVVGGVALYLAKLAWPYLAGAVVAVTLVVPEAVSDWTDGSLGAVGGVLLAGVTLLVASFVGYRIRAGPTHRGRRAEPARAPGTDDVVPLAGAAASGSGPCVRAGVVGCRAMWCEQRCVPGIRTLNCRSGHPGLLSTPRARACPVAMST